MEARIQYLALVCKSPQSVADYYKHYFGLRELGASASGDISLTDGFYNLALLRERPELGEEGTPIPSLCTKCNHASLGVHHFGIAVDDIGALQERLKQHNPEAELQIENGDLHHGEYRVFDPVGLPVSVSTRDFGVPEGDRQIPCIRHIALAVPQNDDMAAFYTEVFGFRETSTSLNARSRGSKVRWVGDGSTAVAILIEPEIMQASSEREGVYQCLKGGVNHFGFLVSDLKDTLNRLPQEQTGKRPPTRPSAEYRVSDPEGNPFDVSQVKGYEVDVDVWMRFPEVAETASAQQ